MKEAAAAEDAEFAELWEATGEGGLQSNLAAYFVASASISRREAEAAPTAEAARRSADEAQRSADKAGGVGSGPDESLANRLVAKAQKDAAAAATAAARWRSDDEPEATGDDASVGDAPAEATAGDDASVDDTPTESTAGDDASPAPPLEALRFDDEVAEGDLDNISIGDVDESRPPEDAPEASADAEAAEAAGEVAFLSDVYHEVGADIYHEVGNDVVVVERAEPGGDFISKNYIFAEDILITPDNAPEPEKPKKPKKRGLGRFLPSFRRK